MRSRASSFKWEYPLLSLRSSYSFLHLLPCLPVTSIPLCIFPSITRCRRQLLRKMWPIQFAFRLRISCRIFLCSLTLSNTSSFLTWSVQLIFYILLQHHISKLSRCFWSIARSVGYALEYFYDARTHERWIKYKSLTSAGMRTTVFFFDITSNLLYFLVKLPSPFTLYIAGEIKISTQHACSLLFLK